MHVRLKYAFSQYILSIFGNLIEDNGEKQHDNSRANAIM